MHVQWVAKYIIYSWNLPSFFDCFFTGGWTFWESNSIKSFQIWWISETKRLVSTLRLWSSISSPQIRQSEARCWTWISIRLIKLFWPWKEKKAKDCINAKKVITRFCDVCVKPGRRTRSCVGPRNSKIVYQNSRLSTIPTFNMIKVNDNVNDMTIEEKYQELRKKAVNRKNNRYLFTYMYLENRPKSRLHRVV